MNKGNRSNNPAEYETGEIRIGIQSPGNDWIKADGSIFTKFDGKLQKKLFD